MKHGLVTPVVIMILKETETFHVLFVVSLFCGSVLETSPMCRSTVAFRKVPLFTSSGLRLGLYLKNLVLFTSLNITSPFAFEIQRRHREVIIQSHAFSLRCLKSRRTKWKSNLSRSV